mmetsp:Transcript_67128/g.158390  ORF Transcript_67128/g.158390 Transcript_67128/m.158390 type:complete len:248 (+) Transcript_67128:34-777(+)
MPRTLLAVVAIAVVVAGIPTSSPQDSRVLIEQFGMVQCPLTSTWLNFFWKHCIVDGAGIAESVTFQEYFVGGKHGGPVTNATWNTSFHGPGEILGDKFHLCARAQSRNATLDKNHTWLDFEACMNGKDGLFGIGDIPKDAKPCAAQVGLDFDALSTCANGDEGTQMYHDSVWHTSNSGVKYVGPNIPVIHINGVEFKGIPAYKNLTARICDAARQVGALGPNDECHCSKALSDEELDRIDGLMRSLE